ncbi:hypothetical protein [Muribaculum intestinale]|uniref:hypothetical protein n=1 Tax=Muribaculum intestinale TaxID=1796646 RepID=UPI0025A685E9|nr:hypothetical protein [Muribaculum intestinale]
MIECHKVDSKNIEAVLLFKREQLIYDIRNLAYVEGDIMPEAQQHERHTVQDIGEAGNIDRVTRIFDLALSECSEWLYPFTKRRIYRECLDDRLTEKKVYSIFMRVPKDFSQTTLNAIENLVHEYLVCSALADWLSIANPKKAAVWKEKTEELKTAIKNKPRLRRNRLRISQHPF